MKFKLKLFIAFALCANLATKAQTEEPNKRDYKFAIGLMPQYSIYGGMRVDFDIKLKPQHYLTIGPQAYYAKNTDVFYTENTDFSGFGVNINYRYFPSKLVQPTGFYLGAGLVLQSTKATYTNSSYFISYTEDGLPKQMYANSFNDPNYPQTQSKRFFKGGYDLLVGYQRVYENTIFLDAYAGWGFRLSDYDAQKNSSEYWGETIFDPGYSGFLPLIGFRFGIFLN